jgi:tetratricopeptide (TPR) repeat protein
MAAGLARRLAITGADAGDGAVWLGIALGLLLQALQLPLIALRIIAPNSLIRAINHNMTYVLLPTCAIAITPALYIEPALTVAAAPRWRSLITSPLIAAGFTGVGWHLFQAAREDALGRSPNRSRPAAGEQGMASIRARDYAAARDEFTRVIERKLDFSHAYLYRGVLRAALGNYVGPLADLDTAVTLRPDGKAAYHPRADIHERPGDRAAAYAGYRRATEIFLYQDTALQEHAMWDAARVQL